MKNIQKIINLTDWEKKWSVGDFTLLSSSNMAIYYYSSSKKEFGYNLGKNLFVFKYPSVICYQSSIENKQLGQFVAKKIKTNKKFLLIWLKKLINKTKILYGLLQTNPKDALNIDWMNKFQKHLDEHLPLFVAVSRSANFVSPKNLKRLQKARLYTESLYEDVDKFYKKILNYIAKTEQHNPKLINTLYYTELVEYIRHKKLPSNEILKKRLPYSGLFCFNGKCKFVSGNSLRKIEALIAKKSGLKYGFAKGQTAYSGQVKGKVRIILNPSSSNFKKGNILITPMTRPDFVPLMKIAGAVITDGGGILSHAAIVSREFKIPCVIGTKTATKAFKDGDLVEVNANKGWIKKIK